MPIVKAIHAASAPGDVALNAAVETNILGSGPFAVPTRDVVALVFAWAQVQTAAATTALTMRLYRGASAAGVLVSEANAEEVDVAGDTKTLMMFAPDPTQAYGDLEYALSVQATGPVLNGAVLQCVIVVLLV